MDRRHLVLALLAICLLPLTLFGARVSVAKLNHPMMVMDATGRLVFEEDRWAKPGLNRWKLDPLRMASGVYYLQVSSGSFRQVIEVMKHD